MGGSAEASTASAENFGMRNSVQVFVAQAQWSVESSKCLNCVVHEAADHLNRRCSNKICRALLSESLRDLVEWMEDHVTHPDLMLWLPLYIQKQGHRLFDDMTHPSG